MPSGQEAEQGGQVAGEVQQLGVGRGAAQTIAEQRHEANGEEGSGPGTEETVIKADDGAHREGESALPDAVTGVQV